MLGSLTALVATLLSFLFVITVVITLHELGHFWAAKACRMRIEAFSIGFGPRIFSRTDKSGVEWRVGWIPLGGYVKFAGDANAASVPDKENLEELREEIEAHEGAAAVRDYFHFRPVWQRAFVTAAGPAMNFLLSIGIFSILLLAFGAVITAPRVGQVAPNSAAETAGFQEGDLILKADGREVTDFDQLRMYVVLRSDDPILFEVDRGGKRIEITATPRRTVVQDVTGAPATVGQLGIAPSDQAAHYRTERYNPIEAVAEGTRHTFSILGVSLRYISRVVTGRESADQLGGPVGIARAAGAVSQQAASIDGGFWFKAANVTLQLVQLIAVISVGIGFLNLLPIPVLDGGHLLFYGYEAVARRPLDARIQAAGFQVGLALLLGLMLFVTWNDLKKLPLFQHMGGLFS